MESLDGHSTRAESRVQTPGKLHADHMTTPHEEQKWDLDGIPDTEGSTESERADELKETLGGVEIEILGRGPSTPVLQCEERRRRSAERLATYPHYYCHRPAAAAEYDAYPQSWRKEGMECEVWWRRTCGRRAGFEGGVGPERKAQKWAKLWSRFNQPQCLWCRSRRFTRHAMALSSFIACTYSNNI